jgi:KDO2-lipid IV(A) lauroyltransferase
MIPSALAIRLGMGVARWCPAPILHATARGGGRLAHLLAGARRHAVQENMRRLVEDASRRPALARRVMPNLAEAAVDLWRLPSLPSSELETLVAPRGLDHVTQAHARGRGVILAGAHLGPYELAGAWLAAQGFPVHAMVETMTPETAEALAAYRTSTGMQLIDRTTGPRALLRVLKAGGIVALICDRMVGEGAPGMMVPFGHATREIPTGPAAFAVATGAPVVTGAVVRSAQPGARYDLEFDPPFDPADHDVPSLTRTIGARLSRQVMAHPDEWYVFQPAWRDDQP